MRKQGKCRRKMVCVCMCVEGEEAVEGEKEMRTLNVTWVCV